MRKTVFIFFFLASFCFSYSQKYSTKSDKAIRKFEDATYLFNVRRLDEAIAGFEAAIKEDDRFIEAYLMLADIYNMKRNYEKEADTYKKVCEINPDFFNRTYLNLAKAQYLSAKYDEAEKSITVFLAKKDLKQDVIDEAGLLMKKCDFSIEAIKNPVPFEPESLGDSINSEYDDYWPYLTADDQILVFTRDISKRKNEFSLMRTGQEDIYISRKVNGVFSKAKSIGPPINTEHNEGSECISVDGQYLFFTGCGRIDGEGDCDIYLSKRTGNLWSKPVNLGPPVNTGKWESTPSLSADGKTLYFATNRKGGKGRMDIWTATLSKDGGFNAPVNLGDSINTPEDEFAPFIHPDGKTLYFASNGGIGLGGFDVYITRKDSLGKWSKPVNLGYPINTNKDEIGLIVDSKSDMAILASDRFGGRLCDLYSFDLYKKVKPIITTYVKGIVFNAVTKQKLKTKLELYDIDAQKMVAEAVSNETTGEYLVCLPIGKNYGFCVSKEGYMFYSENFSLKDHKDTSKPYIMDIALQPIQVDNKVILKNIFYEFNSYELKPESKVELDNLIFFMQSNALVKIEISGHTDNIGTKAYNQKLSENRSKSVYIYLIEHGIPKDRLSYKGYDFSIPVAPNDTEEGRAQNRRTEFKIVSLN
ncbi:MAG: PD40 domain-containing protein [Bacteroidia bacterium]|nr:PD40 domain-containing protein [Bacteroidia bacterium]